MGGGDIAKTVGNTNINILSGNVIKDIYGGGNIGIINGTSFVHLKGGQTSSIYGGGYAANVDTTNIYCEGGKATNVFGGSNTSGTVTTSNIFLTSGTVENLYGGNNRGGETISTNVSISGGTVTKEAYGGGNQAISNETHIQVSGGNITANVYGGGNAAGVNQNTNVRLDGATIGNNVYGGGNEGIVTGNTFVNVKNSQIANSLYAGGNGITAIVHGNTNLSMEGTTNKVTKNVFGGGNQAATGEDIKRNSVSTVNIAGGNIGGNVYGGANTSVVYGETKTNIGYDAVGDNNLIKGNIEIAGTIFGGGEANESGSEIYDFSFISVTNGTNININGNGHTKLNIKGSIFGSGNASSTSGASYINLNNYGSIDNPIANISIQRATLVTLNNSILSLSGAKDRTNEYSNTYFSVSRVDEMKLKNNSTLYLICGANLLKKISSVVDENGIEVKGIATINKSTGETIKNVDNRIYIAEGKNLNIATNEQVTTYGEVKGMFFFGLFTNIMNPSTSTGLYHNGYKNGDKITNAGTFSSNSYVIAQHSIAHDTAVDGFYSNYDNTGNIKAAYIDTTPQEDVYYMWLVGSELNVTTFDIALTASKYATLGTYELSLTGFSTANLKFTLTGFSAGLANGISLVDPNTIPDIAADTVTANSVYGIAMKTGNNGWQNKGETTFLTANGGSYKGNSAYASDNSTSTPTLNFCLYHAQNISLAQNLGNLKMRFQVLTPIDDLNYSISYVDINVALSTALYQDDFYEAAITPGQEFGLFTTTPTNITATGVFSTYYSLYIENFSNSKYHTDYNKYKRVLVSRNAANAPYVLPANTKITMLDMISNQYYYYIVKAEDITANKYIYNLSDFVAMGSSNKKYDEAKVSSTYYNSAQNLIYENFIFHIDFGEAQLQQNIVDNSLLMELRDSQNKTLIGVLGIERDAMLYGTYMNKEARIQVSTEVINPATYLGNTIDLKITTNFIQEIINSKIIYDTQYFDNKMGVVITIHDNNGNKLNSDSLLGINFSLDGIIYYPRIDGTIRIKVADKVSNVLSRIKINTQNNKMLATGTYTIRVESFGSPDGVYYGQKTSDKTEVQVTIINSAYGLKVTTNDNSKIIDKTTGKTLFGNNSLTVDIAYSSGLANPNIAVSLYRRDYSNTYSQNYNLVDLKDYVTNMITPTARPKEYLTSATPTGKSTQFFLMKENLMTGTYKLVYKLYDNNKYIGEAYEYIIIK